MSSIQDKLNEILSERARHLGDLEAKCTLWKDYIDEIHEVMEATTSLERLDTEIVGLTKKIQELEEKLHGLCNNAEKIRLRFSRDTLCIGIGGAGRMGKSTLLQSITGLSEEQIPTSDKYFTTAIRSVIEYSSENIAIVDFHSERTFLWKVIAPLCAAIKIETPSSLDKFRQANFALPGNAPRRQDTEDVLRRLQDAQKALGSYERFLTGKHGCQIVLDELRPFVAYPEGGSLKAGPFLAVSNLVIRVKFPFTDVSRLRIIDLPGLGEAGVDLAKVQTDGMADICDVTFLVKRPTETNIQWTVVDTNALDAMSESLPYMDDQTKYTAILANVGGMDQERARLCVESIRNEVKRGFEIIECNAKDPESVQKDTMPRILDFLARSLPVMDAAQLKSLDEEAEGVLSSTRNEVDAIKRQLNALVPDSQGAFWFGKDVFKEMMHALTAFENQMLADSDDSDEEWQEEGSRVHKDVDQWINDGCGYGSSDDLVKAIQDEITISKDRPANVINECRIKFRAQWEQMDLHLDTRITVFLEKLMDILQEVLHGLVPERAKEGNALANVRRQIFQLADRIDARYSSPEDEEALRDLSVPLRRIAAFDLQFRFHLEPMLHAMTHLLVSRELPNIEDYGEADAKAFCKALQEKLKSASAEYAEGLGRSSADTSMELERQKTLLSETINDPVTRNDLMLILDQISKSIYTFSPNRVFTSVLESFTDAFMRSKGSQSAFHILADKWHSELTPAPDERTRTINVAIGTITELLKHF